jgi:hypothetical protein
VTAAHQKVAPSLTKRSASLWIPEWKRRDRSKRTACIPTGWIAILVSASAVVAHPLNGSDQEAHSVNRHYANVPSCGIGHPLGVSVINEGAAVVALAHPVNAAAVVRHHREERVEFDP